MPEAEAISKALSRLLRHEAGTRHIPITTEGWVKWDDALNYSKLRGYNPNAIWDAVQNNSKDRFTSASDEEGIYWIAAWSGHTIPDCVGPSREVPPADVPKLLVHGTYRKHVPQIEVQGLKRFRRDLHLQDPFSHARRWRKGLEVKINIDTDVAQDHGCRFRVTGNLVWLCDRDIPKDAVVYITEWDDLVPQEGKATPVIGDVGRSRDKAGVWEPDGSEWQFGPTEDEPKLATQEVSEVAKELGQAVTGYPELPSISVNPTTWEVILEEEKPEARSSPGHSDEDSCDWSEEEAEREVVEAEPAQRVGSVGSGASSSLGPHLDVPSRDEEAKGVTADVEMAEAGMKAPSQHAISEEETPKLGEEGDEPMVDKTIIEAEGPAPPRPKWLRFGSAQIHILQAIAAADAANWNSLQQCLKEEEGTPREKSELVKRLEQLADLRQTSRTGALKALEEHRAHAKDIAEQENEYQKALGVEAARLEMYNPVGPRARQPLITTNRLEADIAAGVGIWKARRDHRARERAAQHRKAQSQGSGAAPENAGTLVDVDADLRGAAVDDQMRQRARQEIRDFRKDLRAGEYETSKSEVKRTHQRDSERRRKLKRDRYKEKARAKRMHDDADRDSNHGIAHRSGKGQGTVARYAPGLLTLILCGMSLGGCCSGVDGGDQAQVMGFWYYSPAVLIAVLLGFVWWRSWYTTRHRVKRKPMSFTKVGGRRRVKFKKDEKEPAGHPKGRNDVPFLGGPSKAKLLSPAGAKLRFSPIQGAAEWEQESLALMLDRYAASTKGVYQSQLKWWNLFCLRRDLDPIRVARGYDRQEEQIFLDFLVHCSSNEKRAPGTVKLRLAAVRSYHLTLGLPDPTAQMPRIPLALLGIKRRYGTKERRRPVTPMMLTWIGEVLEYGRRAEAALIWAAITFGFFFLLRASEYLDVGYVDPGKGMKGIDVLLRENGTFCQMGRIPHADEVVLTVRGSKTDIYNKGESRNHFATTDLLCPVKAAINLFRHYPQRYRGGSEDQAPLFRTEDGKVLPRAAVTSLLEASAKALGMPEGDLGTHSLRFGGASAIWASYGDSQMVKRWGRWSSDSFQTYIWDARKSAQGVAEKMSKVDLTPT